MRTLLFIVQRVLLCLKSIQGVQVKGAWTGRHHACWLRNTICKRNNKQAENERRRISSLSVTKRPHKNIALQAFSRSACSYHSVNCFARQNLSLQKKKILLPDKVGLSSTWVFVCQTGLNLDCPFARRMTS